MAAVIYDSNVSSGTGIIIIIIISSSSSIIVQLLVRMMRCCLKRNKQLMQTMLNPYCSSVNTSAGLPAAAGQYG